MKILESKMKILPPKLMICMAVTEKVLKQGMDLTQAFNACGVCDDPNIGDTGGVIGLLTGGRVSRPGAIFH